MNQQTALKILESGSNVLLTGPAGTGKTFVLNKFIKFLKDNKINVGITASTGIAATHINGTTIHSWAGFGIKNHLAEHDLDKITNNKFLIDRINSAQVLIIDEISMLHDFQFDMIDLICRNIKDNILPFGGIQIVLCGDFFQLPPVDKVKTCGKFIVDSNVWKKLDLKVCYLTDQYRQKDNELSEILLKIRSGIIDENLLDILAKRINIDLDRPDYVTKLYTHNADVDAINLRKLEKLPGKETHYKMKSTGSEFAAEKLKKNCLAPETLIVKKNATVMFVANNFGKGYVNGTIGKIIDFNDDGFPIVKTRSGHNVIANPHTWTIEENNVTIASIIQVPLRLAWAITVHKSQGMTLDAVETDLSKAFTYGLGYVALSRVRSLKNLKLLGLNETALLTSEEAKIIDKKLIKQSQCDEKIDYNSKKYISEKKERISEMIWKKITKYIIR